MYMYANLNMYTYIYIYHTIYYTNNDTYLVTRRMAYPSKSPLPLVLFLRAALGFRRHTLLAEASSHDILSVLQSNFSRWFNSALMGYYGM